MAAPIVVAAAKMAAKAAGKKALREVNDRSPGGLIGAVVILLVLGGMFSMMMLNASIAVLGSMMGSASDDCGGSSTPSPASLAGIPQVALEAYQSAGRASGVDWVYIAAIGKHESQHGSANGATLGANGVASPMIKTPPLNGSGFGGNTTPMPYGGEGAIDGWDHGIGPMQFLLSTWYGGAGKDGNLDGKKDPNNIWDAALATGLYLRSLGAPGDMDKAIFGYNRSTAYVNEIKASAAAYRLAAKADPASSGGLDALTQPKSALPGFAFKDAGADTGAATGPYTTAQLGPVQPQAIVLANTLAPMFNVKTVGGFREGDQDHGDGLAIDFMTFDDKAQGDALAKFAQDNAKELGVKYIIWYQKIWNISRADEGWRPMEDRGSPTQNHLDHVHISLTGTPGTGLTDSGGCGYLPAGSTGGKNEGDNSNNAWGGYSNGRIPQDALCRITYSQGDMLRCDAQQAFERLNMAYRDRFGANVSITDSYRPYEEQVAVYSTKPAGFAAKPGTSNHGWAMAMDLGGGINSFGTAQYNWMKANAPRFGWVHPSWAEPGGSAPEPWHWVYTG